MLAHKQDRAQTIAAQNNLPCIYFVDGGGAKLDAKAGAALYEFDWLLLNMLLLVLLSSSGFDN